MTDKSLNFLVEVLLCPHSGKELTVNASNLYSPSNKMSFPNVAGIPWVYRSPEQQLLQWSYKIKSVLDYHKNQANKADTFLRRTDILVATKKRLTTLKSAHEDAALFFSDTLEKLTSGRQDKSPDGSQISDIEKAYFEKIPRQQTVAAYEDTLFRDWVWGKTELETQSKAVLPHLKDVKRLLVLGAGACGLPLEVHQQLPGAQTLAVDINPLLLITAKRILSGETVEFVEFPKMADSLEHVAIRHKVAGQKSPAHFHLLFADAQTAEFKPGAFDALLTPWLIDIVSRDFRELARHFNVSLETGGRWVNIGLLDFRRNDVSQIYSKEEISEALEEAGFSIDHFSLLDLPYLQAPYSTMGRKDRVLIFSATKKTPAKKPVRYNYLPQWLIDWQAPIPLQPEVVQFQIKSGIFAQTVHLVDGKRSVEDIAKTLSSQFGMDMASSREAVYNFFINTYEQFIFREF